MGYQTPKTNSDNGYFGQIVALEGRAGPWLKTAPFCQLKVIRKGSQGQPKYESPFPLVFIEDGLAQARAVELQMDPKSRHNTFYF